ncbi:MAG: 16S rRNA (cytidine(1402)-2'-O)-methyltransferase [Deltaproteobacteria bacterium]|nr:16S rRNA (cytidine(1402)-2'-O)-methyltransferase [Candidatus Zymogenaceae bacterium]
MKAKNQEKNTRSDTQNGILYVISTPIGNLGDITVRAVEILHKTTYVAAEKISHTKKLLSHYRISATYISYREENRVHAADEIIRLICAGHDVALVSDAGTPGISDPGHYLIERCISLDISVVPIPGASSALAALTKSGFSSDQFIFIGFLPRKGKKRTEILEELSRERRTAIIFESPKRTINTLRDMAEHIQDRPVALCRELTKLHETCLRGTAWELIDISQEHDPLKGEVVLVVSGFQDDPKMSMLSDEDIKRRAEDFVRKYPEAKTGTIAAMLSKETGVRKSRAYRMIVDVRERKD